MLLLTLGDQTRYEVVILLHKSHVKVYNISDTAMKTRGLGKHCGHLGSTPLRCKRLQLSYRPLITGPSCDPSHVQGVPPLPLQNKNTISLFPSKKKKKKIGKLEECKSYILTSKGKIAGVPFSSRLLQGCMLYVPSVQTRPFALGCIPGKGLLS